MEIDETGQNDPRHLDRRVGCAALRPSSSLGTTRTAPGKSAPSAARSKSLRGHRAARKRRVHLHIRHVPGRCLHQPSDSVVRSPLEQMFEFGMRGRPSSFNIPRCRVQPCPAEDVNVRDQTLRREYSDGGHEAHGFALFKPGSQTSLVARGLLGHRKRIRTTMTISHSPAQEFK